LVRLPPASRRIRDFARSSRTPATSNSTTGCMQPGGSCRCRHKLRTGDLAPVRCVRPVFRRRRPG
jgi:hypothetical protein